MVHHLVTKFLSKVEMLETSQIPKILKVHQFYYGQIEYSIESMKYFAED